MVPRPAYNGTAAAPSLIEQLHKDLMVLHRRHDKLVYVGAEDETGDLPQETQIVDDIEALTSVLSMQRPATLKDAQIELSHAPWYWRRVLEAIPYGSKERRYGEMVARMLQGAILSIEQHTGVTRKELGCEGCLFEDPEALRPIDDPDADRKLQEMEAAAEAKAA
jgi:hypothetical protein